MFSLLKLLFVCFTPLVNHLPIYNQVNTNSELVEEKIHKNWYNGSDTQGGFAGGGLIEYSSYQFFSAFKGVIENNDNVFNTGVSASSFLSGNSTLSINTSSLPISIGMLARDSQNNSPYHLEETTALQVTRVKFEYVVNNDYSYDFNVRFYIRGENDYFLSSSSWRFLNVEKTNYCLISTSVSYYGNYTIISHNSAVVVYAVNYFKGLLPSSIYTVDNQAIYNNGYDSGYDYGYDEGYDNGYDAGQEIAQNPESDIYQSIYNAGKQVGRSEGIAEASANSGVPALIFTGILNVALLPVDIFLQMFQYEVFGINIAGLISGLLTVCMVIVIIRFLFGGKNGGGNNP